MPIGQRGVQVVVSSRDFWGGSDIVGMFGIGWLNVGFGVSPSHMEHFPLLFQLVDRFNLFRWFARSSASSGTVEVGKGDYWEALGLFE